MQEYKDPTLMELIERNMRGAERDSADIAIWNALECAILLLSKNPAATDKLLAIITDLDSHPIAKPVAVDAQDNVTNAKTPA